MGLSIAVFLKEQLASERLLTKNEKRLLAKLAESQLTHRGGFLANMIQCPDMLKVLLKKV